MTALQALLALFASTYTIQYEYDVINWLFTKRQQLTDSKQQQVTWKETRILSA